MAKQYRRACVKLAQRFEPRIVVEVGVYRAALSKMLLAEVPSVEKLYLVDSWEGSTPDRQPPYYLDVSQADMDRIAQSVKDWAATEPRVEVLHMRSFRAASLFSTETVDFFHTDGDHTYPGVRADISAWLPVVKEGGVLSGDNYEIPTVAKAVDELLPHRELLANGRLWWAVK